MTVSPPLEPILPPPRRPWGVLALVAVVLVVVAYLAFSSIGSALVYYRTPSEVAALDDAIGRTMRLGGVVKPGSVQGPATDLTFVITDGDAEITVHSTVAPTRSFREGSGAVVEGQLGVDGVFEATQVIVKHDENYEAPAPGALPSDRAFDPGDD
ncbi:MAG TPA: cytochrome c maturation protein CcmE [Candidatus Limnocylindria bacterium]